MRTKVLAFDLNTNCTGVFGAVLKSGEINSIQSSSIMVPKYDHTRNYPYMTTKKKLPAKPGGEPVHMTYCLKFEEYVSATEKKKRDAKIRHAKNKFHIDIMSRKIGLLLHEVKPDFVLVERNEMFNGIMTIEILAKLTGTLIGECNALGIPYRELNVNTVRKPYNVAELSAKYAKTLSPEKLASIKYLSKEAIRDHLSKKYARLMDDESIIRLMKTLDESDAALVFDYWYEYIYKAQKEGLDGHQ